MHREDLGAGFDRTDARIGVEVRDIRRRTEQLRARRAGHRLERQQFRQRLAGDRLFGKG